MSQPSKWSAFLLSLAAPGAGQLYARSLWCVPWLCAAAMLMVVAALTATPNAGMTSFKVALFVVLALLSAEHAKRLCEVTRTEARKSRFASRISLPPRRRRAVKVRLELDVPYDQQQFWFSVADLPNFLTIDPFHEKVTLMRTEPQAGVDLVLSHNAFGLRFQRFGRILRWEEGRGYAFSDLPRNKFGIGFPHVFFVKIEAADDRGSALSRLTIEVRGKWTSRWIPATVARWWLYCVCREHARLLRKAL